MATTRPSAVSTSASEIPADTAPIPPEPEAAMPWKAEMTPTTVPSSPTNGAVEPMVARRADALLQVVGGERGGALNGAADGVEQVLAIELAAALVLELVLLQAGQHHLGEVAVAVVLRLRQRDRFLQAAFLEVLGHLRRVELRLLARLREGVDALDGDADRPERHDEEDEADGLRDHAHLRPHVKDSDPHLSHPPVQSKKQPRPGCAAALRFCQ